jgi:hypothetical protein
MELWSAHVPARLLNFCCRTHFVRCDYVSSRDGRSAVGVFNIEFWRRLTLLSTRLKSRDLTWSSGRLTCQHKSLWNKLIQAEGFWFRRDQNVMKVIKTVMKVNIVLLFPQHQCGCFLIRPRVGTCGSLSISSLGLCSPK